MLGPVTDAGARYPQESEPQFTAAGFVPLDMFCRPAGEEEAAAEPDIQPAEEEQPQEPPPPPGVSMTEEELDQQLRDAFNRGLQEGKSLAERGLEHVFRSLRSAADEIRTLREKVVREAEDDLLRLVLMIARKVILREVSQDRTILLRLVQAATSGLAERTEITVRLNPSDHTMITASHEEQFRRELQTEGMRLKADPAISPGDCQIDTDMGTIDAGIEAQLEEIYRCLLEERSRDDDGGA
jgi:flagellar assembly protein FliH